MGLQAFKESFGFLINIEQPSLWFSVASILFNPIFWNFVAQNGERHHPSLLVRHSCSHTIHWQSITRRPSPALSVADRTWAVISLQLPYSPWASCETTCERVSRIVFLLQSSLNTPLSRYHDALAHQPKYDVIPYEIAKPLAYVLFGVGQLLVLSSTWALGITGASYHLRSHLVTQRLIRSVYA
jgi:phosphatidylethanolamine/phosphatidyl-N-methylethanolamine N-methyltransferase